MMKKAKGTHRPLGKTGGVSAGLESGVAEVKSLKESQGPARVEGSQRPKPEKLGSVAVS